MKKEPRMKRRRSQIGYTLFVAYLIGSHAFELRSFGSPPTNNLFSRGSTNKQHSLLFAQVGGEIDTVSEASFVGDTADTSTLGGENGVSESADYALTNDDHETNIKHATTTSRLPHHNGTEPASPFFASPVSVASNNELFNNTISTAKISRRELFQRGALLLFGGAVVGGSVHEQQEERRKSKRPFSSPPKGTVTQSTHPDVASTKPKTAATPQTARLAPVNLTQVAAETNINVTLDCEKGCISVDSKNFTKIKQAKVPTWLPPYFRPPPKVIKEISDSELLIAATIAGAATEMFRTSLLYPIITVKTRIQTDSHNLTLSPPPFQERIKNLGTNVRRHVREGDLYAGITPSLLVSVPATGVYYGVRDVSKRMLNMIWMDDVAIALGAALVADVVSLSFRAPADVLAVRLQNQDRDVGDWFTDSLQRLPAIILTDLPYLLSKIFLGRQFIHGNISIDRYAEYAVISAVLAALVTTPFDVARTRILVDSDGDFSNGIDGGSGEGVLKTMISVTKEGRGGIANLFAGWFERVLYLGIARALLEPLQIIGYVGIRDAVLLEWF